MSKTVTQKLCMSALLAFGFAVNAAAGESCPPPPAQHTPAQVKAASQNARDHGFLWRISKDGHTSYLYGTMHIAKFEWMFPGPDVKSALRDSDTVALELDEADPEIKRRLTDGIKALHVTPLPAPLVERMKKLAASACVPYEALANVPPELQVDMLSMLLGRAVGLEPEYGIDGFLAAVAHAAKKQVVSLETPESQLAAIQMDTPEETAAIVKDALDDIDREKGHAYEEQVAAYWANSDYAKMSHFEDWCDCLNTDLERKMMKRLLDDRAPNLADRIDALHKQGKHVFAAVGALHMFGAVGLPVLMEKRGYKVERVEFKKD